MEYKIEIYAPESEVISIRDTLNAVGAGIVGNYNSVISVVNISGYWRPLEEASPVTGKKNRINYGEEVRIDVRCQKESVQVVLDAVREVHPYEEPVINIIPLSNHDFS